MESASFTETLNLHMSDYRDFWTLKDGSLLINISASNICFSTRDIFQNGVDALPKLVDAIFG